MGEVAHPLPRLPRRVHVRAVKGHRAAVRLQDARDRPEERGLARAVRPEDDVDGRLRYGEADLMQHVDVLVAGVHAGQFQGWQGARLLTDAVGGPIGVKYPSGARLAPPRDGRLGGSGWTRHTFHATS